MEMIITACFYRRGGILAPLGFALQTGVATGHFPRLHSAALCGVSSIPPLSPVPFSAPAQSHFVQLSGCRGLSCSTSLTTQPPSLSCIPLPSSSSSQSCLLCLSNSSCQDLSGIKWDSFYSVPGNS